MNSAIERLLSLRVSDVMHREVVQAPSHLSLSDAAALLSDRRISGAPVVDEQGHCVGVITASDFMKMEAEHSDRPHEDCASTGARYAEDHALARSPTGEYTVEDQTAGFVTSRMTPCVQSVSPDATLLDAARRMCEAHVHRLFVLDAGNHLMGVVGVLDVLAATVQAVEE